MSYDEQQRFFCAACAADRGISRRRWSAGFVHRLGSGGPAVVFLPGASAVGLDYFVVQQQVSRFTTAVVYDRGGSGYSDPLPLPCTAAAVATELHELLRVQNIAAPYVLAAHSLGGFFAHRFARLSRGMWLGWSGWTPCISRRIEPSAPPTQFQKLNY
ncbi:alpha/beta fold hydrolase [Nocardia sp. NBC_01388]|uniref:alpha/beta fold hydrolase n=1 Tax=Nocardia sp. NBC_01388 TaxID=2903596 RepID=UPI0032458DB0